MADLKKRSSRAPSSTNLGFFVMSKTQRIKLAQGAIEKIEHFFAECLHRLQA